jgi:5-methylcytosine-specific restriction endonuclease McrA
MAKINKGKRITVFNKYGGKCSYCGDMLDFDKFHIDHIYPIYKKGSNKIDNLNPSCKPCNISKAFYDINEWKAELLLKYNKELENNPSFRIMDKFGIIRKITDNIIFYYEKGI